MANAYYERGSSFNPDELADGDAIEAEFDAVVRGFDTIETQIDTDKAGYPTQTFHVAPATESTHAPQKAQLDAHINAQGGVHGATPNNVPYALAQRDANGDVGARFFVGDLTGNANSASNATDHIAKRGNDAHGATSWNSPGQLMTRDGDGDVAARIFVGDLNGTAFVSKQVSDSAPNGGSATLVSGGMAGGDFFRVMITGTDDGGWAEIATSDNGNEPIFVRQYTGEFVTVARTLTLLDAYGVTKVPFGVDTNGYGYPVQGAVGNGICGGNGDNCSSTVNNLKVAAWWGIGFGPSVNGQAVPYGEYSHWFNTRNGSAGMRGPLSQNSDIRLKENVEVIQDALAKTCSLRGIVYDRKDGGGRLTGVVAQEVQAVLPEAVTVADDEMQTLSVAYGNMVGLLVEAIKELTAKVEALESRVGDKTNRNTL